MKIARVEANARKRMFEVRTRRQAYALPYSRVDPTPSPSDRVCEVFVDEDLGREGFTYRLESGAEGSVPMDAVLEYNDDPAYMANLLLYELTTRAREEFEGSPLSAREIARRLGTSASQLYRLLDPANHSKSLRQVLSLLHVLGCRVEVSVKPSSTRKLAG